MKVVDGDEKALSVQDVWNLLPTSRYQTYLALGTTIT